MENKIFNAILMVIFILAGIANIIRYLVEAFYDGEPIEYNQYLIIGLLFLLLSHKHETL